MTKNSLQCVEPQIHEDVVNRLIKCMLNENLTQDLSTLFKMFSDITRLKILNLLFKEELCVCDIAFLLKMSHSAVSHQLAILRNNHLIRFRRKGKNVYYSLADDHIKMIYDAGLTHIQE